MGSSLKLNPAGKFPSAVLGPREVADFHERAIYVAYWTLKKALPTALTHLFHGGGHGLGDVTAMASPLV